MGFFGVKKKISKFSSWEKGYIEKFIEKLLINLKGKKISFKYDLDSNDERRLGIEVIPRANAYAGNKWSDRAFEDTYINTDLISYDILKNGKKINRINFLKYYTNRVITKDFVSLYITLDKNDNDNYHKFEHHHGLGFRFHHKYNQHGQLPLNEHIDYSNFKYNPIGTTYTTTKTTKYKKPVYAKKKEFEDFKNIEGRGYEDLQEYLNDHRIRIEKILKK